MQTGEVVRRAAFNLLDRIHGGRLNRLKEVNKREILEGISQEYEDRRLKAILDVMGYEIIYTDKQ